MREGLFLQPLIPPLPTHHCRRRTVLPGKCFPVIETGNPALPISSKRSLFYPPHFLFSPLRELGTGSFHIPSSLKIWNQGMT